MTVPMLNVGRTLRLFLVGGVPSGIIVGEIINWTGRVTKVPRSLLGTFVARGESSRTGVYVLVGDDVDIAGRKRIYVGETDNVGARLRQHANTEEKSYWEVAFVVTSKDANLTKSHALFLESRLLEKIRIADRGTIDNTKLPEYQGIPESDIADMTYFCDQIELLLPTLGGDLFSSVDIKRDIESPTNLSIPESEPAALIDRAKPLRPITGLEAIEVFLKDSKFGIQAFGLESNGSILVSKGSQARGENSSEVNTYEPLREHLIASGKLVTTADPKVLLFSEDVQFDSPSAAAAVIFDRNDNGRTSWKELSTGKSLNQWYADQIARTDPA